MAIIDVGRKGKVRVQYVDFGNYGEVPMEDIVVINPNFMQLPIQSVHCGLQGVFCKGTSQWSDEEIEQFSTVQNHNQLVLFSSHDAQTGRFLVENVRTLFRRR